ncbi:MAG: type II toxin-antitoxin system VapC family toxin [Gammaproteobacteria bacterium]|nr:type II toxin-antitoxin system VapC family toxin [Gammaproteobacteria bacterium]
MVVDTNVVAYYWLPGSRTEDAIAVRKKADAWFVPQLWRSEFRNVLASYMRAGNLNADQARAAVRAAESELVEFEREVDSVDVLNLVERSECSAYDCEFVALAMAMGYALITEDARILRDFPNVAVNMAAFGSS